MGAPFGNPISYADDYKEGHNAQIFDHLAGAISPLFFSIFNDHTKLRPVAITVYALAYLVAFVPTITLPKDYVGQAIKD